ncbi:MAG TPA: ATP-binding protein [Candidatus Polarisedimenticolia bacterium]|jgi:signal transduction histidine kinase
MEIRVQGYESQVKLFLVLLVLFLVSAGVIDLNILYRSRSLLVEEAEGRITSTSRAVSRELTDSGLAPRSREPAGRLAITARLTDLARAYSLASLEILDLDGRVIAGTEPWRVGVIDEVAAEVGHSDQGALASGGTILREQAPAQDDSEYGSDRGEILVFVALERAGTGPVSLLKTGHEVSGMRTISRQIRLLAWTQAIAGLVVLSLVFPFVRWVLRPYRALRATAAQLEAREVRPAVEPEDLISSFRGVVEKLKDQERELDRMRALAGSGRPERISPELLDGLTSGVMIVGPEGRITALNPAGETILGAPRGRVVARDFREVFGSSPALLQILRDGVEAGRAHSREVVPYQPPGDRRVAAAHLGVTVSAIPGAGAGGGGAFCLFSDLTEIRGLQERVRLKENLAGLGEMSAGIAHEFRNSLATILGYARLIGREPREGEGSSWASHGEHASAIVREVQSIGRVVDDFLRYARPATLVPTEWDLRSVMADVARQVARDLERPDVRIDLMGEWPRAIRADEGLLRQTFQNLLRNAVEAMPPGPGARGRVTITGSLDPEGGQVSIEVADSGPGIQPEVLDRLFMPFVTTKERGTGLGLALAQKAIVCHDGTIQAANAEGGGARLLVTLPVPPELISASSSKPLAESQRLI